MKALLCVGELALDRSPVSNRLYDMETAGPPAGSFSMGGRYPEATLDAVPSAMRVPMTASIDPDDALDGLAFGDDEDVPDTDDDIEDDKGVDDEDYGDDDDLDDDDDDDDYDYDDDLDDLDDDDDDDLFDDYDDDL